MRRGVTAAMSGLSVVVLGAALRAGAPATPTALAAAPAGVVLPAPLLEASPTTSPATSPATTPAAATAAPPPKPAAASPSARPVARHVAAARRRPEPVATRSRATAAAPKRSAAPATVTVNGAAVDTRYGPVQVQISVRGGRIVRADAIEYPRGSSRDQQINDYAIPQLDDETLQAQSAQIDTVSGATYTSGGYRTSLQSALDVAHRAGAR